jgi:hypothetical protein
MVCETDQPTLVEVSEPHVPDLQDLYSVVDYPSSFAVWLWLRPHLKRCTR